MPIGLPHPNLTCNPRELSDIIANPLEGESVETAGIPRGVTQDIFSSMGSTATYVLLLQDVGNPSKFLKVIGKHPAAEFAEALSILRAASECNQPVRIMGTLDLERSGKQPIYYLSVWGIELGDYSLGK